MKLLGRKQVESLIVPVNQVHDWQWLAVVCASDRCWLSTGYVLHFIGMRAERGRLFRVRCAVDGGGVSASLTSCVDALE